MIFFQKREEKREMQLAIHDGIYCCVCYAMPIIGDRYQCKSCNQYNLCTQCEKNGLANGNHKTDHIMIKHKKSLPIVELTRD
jgi:Zinc finger, ZZ type